jgi:hypothetical protein
MQGVLADSSLPSIDRSGTRLCGKLDLLSNRFASLLVGSDADPVSLLRDMVVQQHSVALVVGQLSPPRRCSRDPAALPDAGAGQQPPGRQHLRIWGVGNR